MSSRPLSLTVAAAVAVIFGLLTIVSGGRAIFGGVDMGAVVPFVLWFNFGAGFAYVLAGIGLWRGGALAAVVIECDDPTTVRRWMRQADIDDGVRDGKTSAEQSELVQLRRDKRRLEMENEILRRAAAYFASATLPK